MNRSVYDRVVQIIIDQNPSGPILEIGPDWRGMSTLQIPWIPRRLRIGLDLTKRGDYTFPMALGTSRALPFKSDSFGTVVSCAVLEHDGRFWESIWEMKRVLEPGGFMIIMVPSYGDARWWSTWIHRARTLLGPGYVRGPKTATYPLHDRPEDYYRFSEECVATILLDRLEGVCTEMVLDPPRCIGWGYMPD